MLKICRVGLYTELLVSLHFADLLSLHLVTSFSHFFSSRCMLELKFVIYHRAASLSLLASSIDVVDVCSIG